MPLNGTRDTTTDTGYQFLFSQPRMVQDLLRGFLPEEWIGWLDPATLERQDGESGSPLDRLDRPDPPDRPLIWRLRLMGGSDWVYLLLKPQGVEDPFVALNLELSRSLLYRAFLRRRRSPARLPAVLPVILYGGESPWTAPRDARELFLPLLPALQRHVPRTQYLLLDAAHGPIPAAAGPDNLISLLCELERSRTAAAVDPLLERLAALLAHAGDEALRRAWSAFLGRSFLPRRFPLLFSAAAPEGVLA
ncbi:MAG TPA: Rpn family recombination-promoting nuclease/putative transposase [Thermoanaerobaculia bacterium]